MRGMLITTLALALAGPAVAEPVGDEPATLVLATELEGRFVIHDAADDALVVELSKPLGREVELPLAPGTYDVHLERPAGSFVAQSDLGPGERVVLEPDRLRPAPLAGHEPGPAFSVRGRNKLELRLGLWRAGVDGSFHDGVFSGADTVDLATGLRFTRYLGERFAVTFGAKVLPIEAGARVERDGVFSGSAAVVALPLGMRFDPIGGDAGGRSVKPFLAASVGPVLGTVSGSSVGRYDVFSGARTRGTIGGEVGGGVDVHLGRHWSIGLEGGYTWMADFADPIAGRDNYSGFDMQLSVGWLFGRGAR